MKRPRWKKGRQGSRYYVLTLINFWFFDMHLLKYPPTSYIDEHCDLVIHKMHYRVNIVLRKAKIGGYFSSNKVLFAFPRTSPRIILFRPDYPHSVSKIKQGTRWVLSFGWVR